MRPRLDFGQILAMIARLLRHPWLLLRCHGLWIQRGLVYLGANPDVVWFAELSNKQAETGGMIPVLLVKDGGKFIFSLVMVGGRLGNLPGEWLKRFSDLDSLRKECETHQGQGVQMVVVDAAIIERINAGVVADKSIDSFYRGGVEILRALADGLIEFAPAIMEVEMLAALDGEELLSKFGPRYGVARENPVRMRGVLRGLGRVLTAPVSRHQMKKALLDLSINVRRRNQDAEVFTRPRARRDRLGIDRDQYRILVHSAFLAGHSQGPYSPGGLQAFPGPGA
jgi:hypothetical protein